MKAIRAIRILLFVMVPFAVFLLLVLAGFQAVPIVTGSSAQAINEAGLQRTRSQAIAKNALILSYRTDQKERTQAISDLEVVLPLFEREQGVLASYYATYHLDDIELLVTASRPDYLALDAAGNAILAHRDKPIEKAQLDIILAHNGTYLVTINQLVTAMQDHVDKRDYHLFLIESGISMILFILATTFFLSINHISKQIIKAHKAEEAAREHH